MKVRVMVLGKIYYVIPNMKVEVRVLDNIYYVILNISPLSSLLYESEVMRDIKKKAYYKSVGEKRYMHNCWKYDNKACTIFNLKSSVTHYTIVSKQFMNQTHDQKINW